MARLNLTLDEDTILKLESHAKRLGRPRARIARDILHEGLSRLAAEERSRKLADDYASDRRDARHLLSDLERPQMELLGDEED